MALALARGPPCRRLAGSGRSHLAESRSTGGAAPTMTRGERSLRRYKSKTCGLCWASSSLPQSSRNTYLLLPPDRPRYLSQRRRTSRDLLGQRSLLTERDECPSHTPMDRRPPHPAAPRTPALRNRRSGGHESVFGVSGNLQCGFRELYERLRQYFHLPDGHSGMLSQVHVAFVVWLG